MTGRLHDRQGGSGGIRRRRGAVVPVGGLIGALVFAVAGVATAGPAAAADSESPSIQAQPWASFVVGAQIDTDTPSPDFGFFSRVPRAFDWTGTDNSGVICDSQVWGEYAGGPPQELAHAPDLRHFQDVVTDYDDQFGGGAFKLEDWQVSVWDCSQNGAYGYVHGTRPRVTQDDNTDGAWDSQGLPRDATISYSRHWWTHTIADASGGTMHETGRASRAWITSTFEDGQHMGLVMATGPRDGQFAVYIDGVQVDTVDTYSARWRPRVIVWDHEMTAGTHTVRLVNLATAGRPHLQLDAVLTDD